MLSKIIPILFLAFFSCCHNNRSAQDKLFKEFSDKFPMTFKDTILIKPNYDTLAKLKLIDTNYLSLFKSSLKGIDYEGGLTFYTKFKVDNLYDAFIITNTAPGGMLSSHLFLRDKNCDSMIYVDELSRFYELHNTGDYLQTTITKSKDTLILTKNFRYCSYLTNPEFGDCKDSIKTQKILKGQLLEN